MTAWVRFQYQTAQHIGTLDREARTIRVHDGDMFSDPVPTGERLGLDAVQLLAPITPGKFVGLWNNFKAVAAAQNLAYPERPYFFFKPTTACIGPDQTIPQPPAHLGKVVYEAELGVVIGARCRDVDEAQAQRAIFGYTCVNDVTAIELLKTPAFPEWSRAKGADGFGPIGPAVVTGLDWSSLRIRARLNGRERQNYPADDMILSPARIVSLLSQEMTLEAGDLIACGTSLGALPMRSGAEVEIEIDGIGILRNSFGARRSERDAA